MKKILLIFLLLPMLAAGQATSTMRFEGGQVWDFGTIEEVNGAVQHTMTFKNSGRIAFVIERVGADCGCTTTNYTKDPVQPGAKGTITLKFDPKDKAGTVEQHVRIVSKGGRNKNEITVRGTVIPRPRSIEEDFPFTFAGGLRISSLNLNFGYIDQGTVKEMTARYVNTGLFDMKLSTTMQPERSWARVEAPPLIKPNERGEFSIIYDLRGTTFYGRYSDRVYLTVNGARQPLPISATFTAVDPPVKSDAAAPDAVFAPAFHHHGTARKGEKLTRTVELTNEGTAPLIIRWVNVRQGMSTSLRAGTTVAAGQTMDFTLTFDTAGLGGGVQTGAVTVLTNDPITPVRELRSAVEVK